MKVGIITFCDTVKNYGQVLQAYALQEFLRKNKSVDSFTINYPFQRASRKVNGSMLFRLRQMLKDLNKRDPRGFGNFKKKFMKLSKRYYSFKQLKRNPPEADCYIVGSDQVWNYDFIKPYDPFFLNFGREDAKRVSYAASFGHGELPKEVADSYQGLLRNFDAISVREFSGVDLCRKMGLEAVHMADPVFLLSKDEWSTLFDQVQIPVSKKKRVFCYFIEGRETPGKKEIIDFIEKEDKYDVRFSYVKGGEEEDHPLRIAEWLAYIDRSDYVISNSFHCLAFSVILNSQFIALPTAGDKKGMNERLYTLLETFKLGDRLYESFSVESFQLLLDQHISWGEVNNEIKGLQQKASRFFDFTES